MLERPPEQPQVGAGVELEPLGQAVMKAPSDFVGELRGRGFADQIVRQPRRTAGLEDQATIAELAQRTFQTGQRPPHDRCRVRQRERAPGDRKQGKEARRVRAGATQLHTQDLAETDDAAAGPGERLKPKRRSLRSLRQLDSEIPIEPRVEAEHELDSLLAAQRRELDPAHPLGWQRIRERDSAAAASSRREDDETLARLMRRADQVVAESEREFVHL